MAMKLIEIGIVLIVIVMIFGVVLTSMENATEKVITSQEINNMEKMASEVIDNLINNPGVPDNWNEYDKGTPGLAIVNDGGQIISNSVSYAKLVALGENYDELIYENQFNSKIKTSMELIPKKSSISSVKIGEYDGKNDVFSVNRLVKCDFYKSYVLNDFKNDGKCNMHHSQEDNSCNYFKVFPGNLKNSDYYLIFDESETHDLKYMIDTTKVSDDEYWQSSPSNVIHLNDEIDFYDDTSAIVFIHLNKKDPKAVLISLPKNFDKDFLEYDYFRTNECELILKAWY